MGILDNYRCLIRLKPVYPWMLPWVWDYFLTIFSWKVGNSHEMKDNLNLNLRKLDNHHSWSWITCHIKITRSGKSNIYPRCKLTFKLFTVLYIFNWHPITLHMNNIFIIIEITAIITKNPLNPGKKSPILALIQFQSPSLTEIMLM